MTADALINYRRWTQGPDFLYNSEETWPQRLADLGEISSDDPEVKKTVGAFVNKLDKLNNGFMDAVLKRFSSWTCLKKVIAWIYATRPSYANKANEVNQTR